MKADHVREYDYLFKIVIVGDLAVGKSCLIVRYTRNEFSLDSRATLGVDFVTRTLKVGGKAIKAQLWDTSGGERFRTITRAYWRGAAGVMVVYDITYRASFNNVQRWLVEMREHAPPGIVVMLVGNKSDLEHKRAVGREEAEAFARKEGLLFMEASALAAVNVEEAFRQAIAEMHERAKRRALEAASRQPQVSDQVVQIGVPQEDAKSKKTSCCS